MKEIREVRNIAENRWLINLRIQMKRNLRSGKTRYVQTHMKRSSYNEPAEESYRYLTLEKCYPRFALFSHSSLWGKTYESYPYDVIRGTISEA